MTITIEIYSDKYPIKLWTLKDYEMWTLTFYTDQNFVKEKETWDSTEYLKELFEGDESKKQEFKEFCKENYPDDKWKSIYKNCKKMYKKGKEISIENRTV